MDLTLSQGNELFAMLTGRMLRQGRDRTVFIFEPDSDLVLKVEHNPRVFANAHEWRMWDANKDLPLGKWLGALCLDQPLRDVPAAKAHRSDRS